MSNTKSRKLTIVRTPTPPLRVEPGEAVHVGVDTHKASYRVALFSDGRGLITTDISSWERDAHRMRSPVAIADPPRMRLVGTR